MESFCVWVIIVESQKPSFDIGQCKSKGLKRKACIIALLTRQEDRYNKKGKN